MNWHQTHTAAKHLSMRENVAVTTAASSCELEAKYYLLTARPGAWRGSRFRRRLFFFLNRGKRFLALLAVYF